MNKYLEALDTPEKNKYLDAIATEIPEVKPFHATAENVNWTAAKEVIRHVPQMAVDISDRIVSGATLGLSDKAAQAGDWLSEKLFGVKSEQLPKDNDYIPPNKYAEGAAEFVGAAVPISAAGNLIAKPIAKKLVSIGEKYLTPAAARYMPALAKVLGWSATGTVYDTASKVVEEGKLPTAKEAAISGLMWGGLETGIGTAAWAGKTALAIRRFAKEAEIKPSLAFDIVFKIAKKEGRPLAEVAKDKAQFHELKKMVIEMPESKIGEPLTMPRDYTGQGAEIPTPLKGVEGGGDVRPLAVINQEIAEAKRQISISKAFEKQKWQDHLDTLEVEKIGMPLLKPQDYTGKGSPIPEKLKGVESNVDVRPIAEINQDIANAGRELSVAKAFEKQRLQDYIKELNKERKLANKGRPLLKPSEAYIKSRMPESLRTILREAEPPLNIEQPLRPDQKAKLAQKLRPEEVEPSAPLSAIEGAERQRISPESAKTAAQKQRDIQAELNKGLTGNKYIDTLGREPLREPPSSVPPDVSKVPGQVSAKAESEIFIRGIKKSEKGNPTRSLQDIPDKEGYDKVYKPYGTEGKGFYYVEKPTTLTAASHSKATPPDAPTSDFSEKTGTGKAERTAGDFISDLNTAFQGKGGLTIQDVALTEKQNAAIERVFADAKKVGKDVSAYMKELGLSPEAVASILERKNNVQAQIAVSTPKEKVGDKIIDTFAKDRSTIIRDTVKNLDNVFGVVSTRLGNVAPELKTRVRKHAFEAPMNIKRDIEKVKPWYKKFEKLSDTDKFELTLLLRNGQYDKDALKQAEKFMLDKKMYLEFKQWEPVKNEIVKRAKDSGMNISEIENYFPNHVKDYVGLRESLGKDAMGKIDEAIAKEAAKRNITPAELGDESKAAITDSMVRGWSKNKIFLFDPFEVKSGIGKSRTLKGLDRNLMQHYHDAGESMVKFIANMNTAIANNNFFRKSRKVGKTIKAEGLDSIDLPMNTREVDSSIGDIITDIKKNKSLSMEQEAEIRHVLTSYMMPKSQGKYLTGIKNLTYVATLGNPLTALTQVQDVGVTISRQGLRNTLQGFGKMFTKDAVKLGDIGIDNWVADFERRSKMGTVSKIAMSPLAAADIFGKKLNMNANLARTQRALKKGSPEINAEIDNLFKDTATAEQVKKDLLSGKKTFDTNFYMFDNLSKYHPISKAEVPTGYLNSDKGRLLYMLHTYQIKQLDVLRNDVLNEFKKGNVKKGAYNMASLTAFIVGSGVGVNAARDFITTGETKDINEYLINNIGQMFLVNRYLLDKGFRDGVGTLLWDGIKPATLSIANDLSKDLKDVIEGNEEKGLRSTKYIPFVGRPYHDMYGRGYENSLERNQ